MPFPFNLIESFRKITEFSLETFINNIVFFGFFLVALPFLKPYGIVFPVEMLLVVFSVPLLAVALFFGFFRWFLLKIYC